MSEPVRAELAKRLLERYEEILVSGDETSEPISTDAGRVPLVPAARRYQLGEELGRGGMGAVFEVLDRNLHRPLAMKVLLGGSTKSGTDVLAGRLQRFLAEAQITGQLDHPGVVPVHELGVDEEGRAYFTMPRVHGREFGEIIRLARGSEGGWSLPRLLDVLVQVGETISYAHSRGVVHRDLKPSNVLVGGDGEVYVLDWGLASTVEPVGEAESRVAIDLGEAEDASGAGSSDSPLHTRDGAVIGTLAYMPPEQALGLVETLGPRTDVYALGGLLYTTLTGKAPHEIPESAASPLEVLERVSGRDPIAVSELAPHTPPALIAICERAMARDPLERYADPEELVNDLHAYQAGRVVRAHEAGTWPQLRKWVKRNRLFAATLAAAIGAVVALSSLASIKGARHAKRIAELGDVFLLEQLRNEQTDPREWVVHPAMTEKLEEWLDRATDLERRLPAHRRRLEELAGAEAGAERYEGLDERRTRQRYLEAAGDFVGETGLLATVRRDLAWIERVERLSIDDHEQEWNRVIAAIAASERYGGLRIEPQLGLVPLGADPPTGLMEFAHLRTARREKDERCEIGAAILPERTPGGGFDPEDDLPLIFVLVPGGIVRHPAAPDEGPYPQAQLEPFFVSKYEMTQAQYERLLDPAAGGKPASRDEAILPFTGRNWSEFRDLLARHYLTLPSEDQWEHAARGGTVTPWSTGTDIVDIRDLANLEGLSAGDRFEGVAPIGSFAPNPFGLHDVHGNVAEYCFDNYGTYHFVPEPITGRRYPRSGTTVVRGGSYLGSPDAARSDCRDDMGSRRPSIGVRPARQLDPERFLP